MPREFFEQFESETTFSQEVAEEYHRRGFWGGMSCGDYLAFHAERQGDSVAVIDDRTSLTWAELDERADAVAAGLRERGVEKGDRVAFRLPNRIEWFVVRFGVTRAGGVSVPVYPRFGTQEVVHVVESTEPVVYVGHADADDGTLGRMASLAAEADFLEALFALGAEAGADEADATGGDGPDVRPLSALSADPVDFSPTHIDADYPDVLGLSSGTTGMPKIFYVPQNTYLSTGKDVMGRCALTEYDTILSLAPVQQALGHILSVYLTLVTGATIAITNSNDPEDQWERVAQDEPTFVGAIPTQTAKMVNSPVADDYGMDSVRTLVNGGAPLPTDVAQAIEEKGVTVVNGYGAGDGGWAATARPMDPQETRIETVGPRNAAMEIRIVDEDGDPVETGEVGEIVMRGGGCCFGYFEDRERTEAVFGVGGPLEGWFHSNDAGVIDADGNLTVVGRMDDMIIRGGQNVYPAEIEDVLMEHDAVVEAAAVGMPDPELGERVCAYVVEEGDPTLTLEDVVEWFDAKGLSTFKWPERLEHRDALPKSAGGKVKKPALEDDIEEQLREEGVL